MDKQSAAEWLLSIAGMGDSSKRKKQLEMTANLAKGLADEAGMYYVIHLLIDAKVDQWSLEYMLEYMKDKPEFFKNGVKS